ncbi:hypothetical protein [Methanolobus sp.]|uniref:hypothetical protein n=1 Tax=Methanolobus sp. TaxID=1874737 RepID=UPI0025E99493|nr:hypothetical protein [Methanolobus sp.]
MKKNTDTSIKINEDDDEQPNNQEQSKLELKDLLYFWESISCWERDQSLNTVCELMDETDIKMCEQIEYLVRYNNIEKQSGTKPCSPSEEPYPKKKPNYEQSMKIIRTLSHAELIQLGEYCGMNTPKMSLLKVSDLQKVYDEALTCRSITLFFGIRNYIGEKYL